VAVDGSGNAYVVGWTSSTDFPATGGFDTTLGGDRDLFVAKFGPGGTVPIWSSYLGGTDDESYGGDVAADANGDIYVVGRTDSTDFPIRDGFDAALGGSEDAFITKISPAGTILWSSYLGGSDSDSGEGVAVDPHGDIYVVGRTSSTDFPIQGGFDSTLDGMWGDAFVAKLQGDGSGVVWSSYLGGSEGASAHDVAWGDEAVYVVGLTSSSDFPVTGGFDGTYGGEGDAFVTKVRADGTSVIWSSYVGGELNEWVGEVAVSEDGDAHLVGFTESHDFPIFGGFDSTFEGDPHNVYLVKVNAGGSLVWSSYLGGSYDEHGRGITLGAQGNLYAAGDTGSPDFPRTWGSDSELYGLFITGVEVDGSGLEWSSVLGGSNYDSAQSVALDANGYMYVVGWTRSTDFPSIGSEANCAGGENAFLMRLDGCGNGVCDPVEDCATCTEDCGSCPDAGLDLDAGTDLGSAPPGTEPPVGRRAASRSGCSCEMGRPTSGSLWLLALIPIIWHARRRRTLETR